MTITLGSGNLLFERVEGWEKLPEGWFFVDAPGVAVDSKDNVYVFNRGEHPVIVLDRDGNFLRAWGEGMFTDRTHGIHIGLDDSVYCVDDALQTVQKFTPEGKPLMTVGTPYQASPKWGGQPFHRPTHVAVSPVTGDLYISDGYGNCRVHKYSPDGRYILSWGEPGVDPGQFIRPHNVAIDKDDNIYVCETDTHRVQVFDPNGKVLAVWNNICTPNGICLDSEGHLYVAEEGHGYHSDCPGLGHRVSIYDLQGHLLTRFGDKEEGEEAGEFITPHGAVVDSRSDLYISEVSGLNRSIRNLDPPKLQRRVQKFARKRGAG